MNTAVVKIKAVIEWLKQVPQPFFFFFPLSHPSLQVLLDTAPALTKIVLFAHHKCMVASLSRALTAAKTTFVRIDGETPPSLRLHLIRKFSEEGEGGGGRGRGGKGPEGGCRVAVVSVTACGLGLDLSAASLGVFVEMPPDVAWMMQAEDRLHRQVRVELRSVLVSFYLMS